MYFGHAFNYTPHLVHWLHVLGTREIHVSLSRELALYRLFVTFSPTVTQLKVVHRGSRRANLTGQVSSYLGLEFVSSPRD